MELKWANMHMLRFTFSIWDLRAIVKVLKMATNVLGYVNILWRLTFIVQYCICNKMTPRILLQLFSYLLNISLSQFRQCFCRQWGQSQNHYKSDLNTARDWALHSGPSHLLKSVSASKKDEYFIMTLPPVWACQLLFFPQLHNTLSLDLRGRYSLHYSDAPCCALSVALKNGAIWDDK